MLLFIFSNITKEDSTLQNSYETQNYTCIANLGEKVLKDYIDNNIKDYFHNIYLKLKQPQQESDDTLTYFIECYNQNKENIPIDQILDKVTTQIIDLEEFENQTILDKLFEHNVVQPCWNNLYYYWVNNSLDETAVQWLNQAHVASALLEEKNNDTEDHLSEIYNTTLIEDIFKANSLSNPVYKEYTDIFRLDDLDLKSIERDKLYILVEQQSITFNPHHYNQLEKTEDIDLLNLFVENNIHEFIETHSEYSFDIPLYKKLLTSKKIHSEQKMKLINCLESIDDIKLIDIVCHVLLESTNEYNNSDQILNLITNTSDQEIRLKMFNQYMHLLNKHEIHDILNQLGDPYTKATEPKKRPKWENTPLNHQIVEKLKENGFISSFKEMGDNKIELINKAHEIMHL
ncbi:hypothetical protein K4L44_05670 [Halosquirtibacter laminarini]|uniref:Uncharacterized protein n=1 Tax=Halosquirtibacter laminarini TaxID=3374600 RepID=A0AC61NI10_9BACT|nr:hypothetical protein K4L44_05670 [Prolixibacteraceae bacterium]